MCGILYSQDSQGFTDLEMLKRRGPEGFRVIENSLGYFVHSMLNTIGDHTPQPYHTGTGILLYNGSTYNSDYASDTLWLADRLDDNLNNTLDVIRELNGEYAIVYVTEKHVVFCVDHFDSRNLWFYHDKCNRELTIASVPSVVRQKATGAWRAEGNNIYVMDRRDYSVQVITNRVFDLEQKTNHFDYVFENFERAVRSRYKVNHSTVLLSSGFDSGVIACATQKIYKSVDCVINPVGEVLDTVKQRQKLHKAVVMLNHRGEHPEKRDMFLKMFAVDDVWNEPSVDPMIDIMKRYVQKRGKKIVLFGNGGDEMYNDWQGQLSGFKWARTNGSFATDLQLIWPWHNYHGRMQLNNLRTDLIAGYFGLEARNPLIDCDLVQAWLHTTCDLKNQGYKSWMKSYLDQEKYPYTMQKVHWASGVYTPEPWKLGKNNCIDT